MLPRAYLLDRFRTDAAVLRQRAKALRSGPPQPGPDAVTSSRMADACDDVISMIDAIPVTDDAVAMITTLTALIPLLEQRAAAASESPAVRAVYAGAATRIREVAAAEAGRPTGEREDLRDTVDDDEDVDEDVDEDDSEDDDA